VGPYIDTKLTEDLELCTYNTNWQTYLDLGGQITVGAKAEVIGATLFDFNRTFQQGFYNLEMPQQMSIFSGNNQFFTQGNTLPQQVKVKVKSNKGFTVPGAIVKFEPQNGGTVENIIAITNTNGIASTTWTPGGSGESQLMAYMRDCDGNHVGNSPLYFTAYSDETDCNNSSLSLALDINGNIITPQGQMGVSPYEYSTDGSNFSSTAPEITINPGQHYEFYVKDANGCMVAQGFTAPGNICDDSDLTLDVFIMGHAVESSASGGQPPYQYSIDNPSGGFTSNNIFQEIALGSHTIYVQDANGCISSESIVIEDENPPITADFNANATQIEPGANVQFTDLSTNNPTSWSWDFGDGNTSSEENPSHTYSSAGTYTVELTVENDYGSDTKTKTDYITVGSVLECPSSFTDSRDGQTYSAVQIGNQCWMAENLNYDQDSYGNDWCYDNNSSNCDTYGRLYDWAAVMQGASSSNSNPSGVQGVCPDGWHVPSDEEWTELKNYVSNDGHSGSVGTALKSTSGWNDNGNGTDDYGFSVLPGGHRKENGDFDLIGYSGYWWSATEGYTNYAWFRNLYHDSEYFLRGSYREFYGFSVRCLRD
jgi:uncharacterized protein (TIGR02145 family)